MRQETRVTVELILEVDASLSEEGIGLQVRHALQSAPGLCLSPHPDRVQVLAIKQEADINELNKQELKPCE